MFESVAPTKSSRASRNVLYATLAFSIVVHGVAAGVALVSTLWQVTFPAVSPPFVVAFSMIEPPPPPPPPAKPLEANKPVTTAKVLAPDQIVAPTVIPDEIPIVRRDVISPVAFAAATGLAGGVDQGQLGGVTGGEAGGKLGGTIGSVAPEFPDGRVHIARNRKLPMLPLSQVYPNYPENARMRLWEDEIVIRYIVGKDGRVKEVTVLQPPLRQIFIDGTLSAIRSWRFRPLIKDGEKQEVVHELTVYYRLNEGAT